MKLKLDANGSAVLQDGKPVYVQDDGKEIAFDAPGAIATIAARNGEAKANRERAEAAEAKLKTFDGIADPAAAIKALGLMDSIDKKKLIDAGEVEKVKAEIIAQTESTFKQRLTESEARRADVEQKFHGLLINNAFNESKFVNDRIAIPREFLRSHFASNFKIENDSVTPYDATGKKILTRSVDRFGETAAFDEALEILVMTHPNKDAILKAVNSQGGGSRPSNGGGSAQKTMQRTAFDQLTPIQKSETMKAGTTIVD